ncbi:MAG: thiamine-phosphate kinase [Bacteroidales bacterium]|nr:thiamine-phosphate kinase [Bacteroidales bacterium]
MTGPLWATPQAGANIKWIQNNPSGGMMSAGEFEYIHWIRSQTAPHPRVVAGPGDDAAVLKPLAGQLLVTTDMLMEGVDFRLAETDARSIGFKAMAVNLSDIAAMAGWPRAAVVAVALPTPSPIPTRTLAEELYRGLRDLADAFDVPIVGGDTNSWAAGLVITVTIFGEATPRGPVTRHRAQVGDWIFVTGPLGGSILGRHLRPKPRIREALWLHEHATITAMADISDGLTADLGHILTASHCGAVLDAAQIPIHLDARTLAQQTGCSPLDHALSDGEDFELVFTVSPADGARLLAFNPAPSHAGGVRPILIGQIVESGLWIADGERRQPLTAHGWTHDFGGGSPP